MSTIELGYGRGSINLEHDVERFSVLSASDVDGTHPLSDVEIGHALDAPIQSPSLDEIISPGNSVLIVVSDATRASGAPQVVNLLVRRIIEQGIAPSDISIIFATGIHRPTTTEEKRELLTPFIAQRIKTLDHDPDDSSKLVEIGDTSRGTRVEVNRTLKEHDHVILTGGVGFHYFAGFTGGRKSICPGLASAETVKATHMLALDFENGGRRDGVGAGLLNGNAVHEECERIAAMVAPTFLVNTIVDERGRVVAVYAGDWRAAHKQACYDYVQAHSIKIESPRDLVIVSCGGSPYDINLIQAHKALDMATHACGDGGSIILLAECADGFGRSDFLKWFDAEDARALERVLFKNYEVNGQSAWSLLTKAERFRVYLVSNLDDESVRRMRMIPVRTLDEALAEASHDTKGYIMPHGSSLLPVV
jgi:lactate racemase